MTPSKTKTRMPPVKRVGTDVVDESKEPFSVSMLISYACFKEGDSVLGHKQNVLRGEFT